MSLLKFLARITLGGFMLFAGIGHFRSTGSFMAQVPPFLPWPELIVQVSGVIEVALGLGLWFARRHRAQFGIALAGFFVLVFPGNISQYLTHTPAFGLDTDTARAIRLLFQPVLVVWALWSTDGWGRLRHFLRHTSQSHR